MHVYYIILVSLFSSIYSIPFYLLHISTDGIYKIRVGCFKEPPRERLLRPSQKPQVDKLVEEISKRKSLRTPLICHLPNIRKENVDERKIGCLEGLDEIEVLGGNHRRAALQELHSQNPDELHYSCWPAVIYCSLSNEQALKLAIDSNIAEEVALPMGFEATCLFFREQLRSAIARANQMNEDGTVPSLITGPILTSWRKQLAQLLGLKVGVPKCVLYM